MYHKHETEISASPVQVEGARNVSIQWLVNAEAGAGNFYLRRFIVAPDGCTPLHEHAWEHEVYILEGEGTVFGGGKESRFRPGDVIFVPPEEEHGFSADAGTSVAFLCLIPNEGKAGGCAPPK